MGRAKPLHNLNHVKRSDRVLVLVRFPGPLWIADIDIDVDRPVLGTRESRFRSSDLLGREREGDDDEGPKEAGVEDDVSPTRRNAGEDIGDLESGFLGDERGGDKDLGEDLVRKGMNGGPRFGGQFGRLCLGEASFEHRRGRVATMGVGDILK